MRDQIVIPPTCDFQVLVDYTDEHEPGDQHVAATVAVTVTFDDGSTHNFNLCEACARDLEANAKTDPRMPRAVLVRRFGEGGGQK